jgi:hypothetical protein
MSTLIPPSTVYRVLSPSDTVDVPIINERGPRAIYVGGVGHITSIDATGASVVISAIPVGTILPIRPTRIMATGTTASLIVGIY